MLLSDVSGNIGSTEMPLPLGLHPGLPPRSHASVRPARWGWRIALGLGGWVVGGGWVGPI